MWSPSNVGSPIPRSSTTNPEDGTDEDEVNIIRRGSGSRGKKNSESGEDEPVVEDARVTTTGGRVTLSHLRMHEEELDEVVDGGASDGWTGRRRKKRKWRKRSKGSDAEKESNEEEEEVDVEPFLKVKELKEDYEVYKHYKQLDKLGEGFYGATYEVVDVNNPQIRLAMKIQKKKAQVFSMMVDPEVELMRLYKELLILNRILPKHKNIIEIKDMLVGPTMVYIVEELCAKLTLEDFYPVADGTSGLRIFKQLVDAVHFVHQYGVVHNDLKPDNILFSDSEFMECKIIDFGVSVYRPDWATKVHNNFNPDKWFKDDEIIPLDDGKHLDDVKALGRILHAIMAGKPVPFVFEGRRLQMRTTYKPRCNEFGEAALNLLQLIGPTPFGPEHDAEFPTMDQIHQHPWLVGGNLSPGVCVDDKFIHSFSQSTQVFKDFSRDFTLLENDLTVLKTLLSDWAIMPLKIINNDCEIEQYYYITGSLQRGDFNTRLLECWDAETETIKLAMKTLYRVEDDDDAHDDQPSYMSRSARQPLRIYNELLITLRILPRHEHIVDIRDVLVHKAYVLVVRELCERLTLEDFFPFARNDNARNIFRQVVETVRFMHAFGVVHMDLHCHHILFTDQQFTNCKIVDFSKALYNKELAQCAHELFRAERWITPELEFMSIKADVEVDVRALGRILYAMMIGKWVPNPDELESMPEPQLALFDNNAADLLSKIGPPPFGPGVGQETLTMDQLCLHPWLFSFNFELEM